MFVKKLYITVFIPVCPFAGDGGYPLLSVPRVWALFLLRGWLALSIVLPVGGGAEGWEWGKLVSGHAGGGEPVTGLARGGGNPALPDSQSPPPPPPPATG